MNKHHRWLARQIPDWIDGGLITDAQGQALRERYPLGDGLSLGRLLLTGLGAIMIGLGVILLFAYNWSEMGKLSKLAVIFGALLGAHAAALYTREHKQVLSESLFALGTMLMGAGIFLVGQIYHFDSHYPNALLIWTLGALVLAWSLPSLTQAFMAVALVILWHVTEVIDFNFANHAGSLLILFGLFPLLWRLRSPLLARFVSVAVFLALGLTTAMTDEGLVLPSLLLTAAALIGLERLAGETGEAWRREMAAELTKPALLVLFGVIYLLTFSELVPDLLHIHWHDSLTPLYFWAPLLAGQAIFFRLLLQRRLDSLLWLAQGGVLLALLPTILTPLLEPSTLSETVEPIVWIGSNLLLLAVSLWLMIGGARRGERNPMLKGSLLFAMLAAARYTDLFDSLLARAVVFLLVGIALFAVNHFYQRNKRLSGG